MSIQNKIPIDDAFEATQLSSTFNCTFDNIPELRKLCPAGVYVDSYMVNDVRKLLNADVFLRFYPCGVDNDGADPNCGSLHLYINQLGVSKKFYVSYQFTVIDVCKDDRKVIFRNEDYGERKIGYEVLRLPKEFMSWGYQINLIRCNKICCIPIRKFQKVREQLTIQVDMKIMTEGTYLRWMKVHPNSENDMDAQLLRKTALDFDNELFEGEDLALIEVSGEEKKLFKVSKDIVCNIGDVFNTRLTKKEWVKEMGVNQKYDLTGYNPDLTCKFLKSMHTGILRWDNWEDQLDLLEISNEYEVLWIKEEVAELLEESLTVGNVCQCLVRSDQSNAKELRQKCIYYCVSNYHEIKKTEEWNELLVNHVRFAVEIISDVANGNRNPTPSVNKHVHFQY